MLAISEGLGTCYRTDVSYSKVNHSECNCFPRRKGRRGRLISIFLGNRLAWSPEAINILSAGLGWGMSKIQIIMMQDTSSMKQRQSVQCIPLSLFLRKISAAPLFCQSDYYFDSQHLRPAFSPTRSDTKAENWECLMFLSGCLILP